MNTTSVLAAVSRKAGGLQNSVRRLHQCLNELPGVSVRIVSLRDEHSAEDMPEWLPLPVKACLVVGPRAFGYSPQMLAELLSDDAPIMHTHGIWQYPSVATSSWHQKTGKPYLISPHGMLDSWAVQNSAWKKRIALAFYERKHLEQAACIRALCESEAQSIRSFGLKNPICVIPNGIDLPVLENAETLKIETLKSTSTGVEHVKTLKAEKLKSEHPGSVGTCQHFRISDLAASGRKVLFYLGRIHPKKGLVNLLRAWHQAQSAERTAEEWVLAIAGWDQGGHEAELKTLATELGIQWADVRANSKTLKAERLKGETDFSLSACQHVSVLFLGPQFGEAKSTCYANCDAFILPSFSEGLPMVILEAWAYGKPVLMTPECNLPEGFVANAAIRIEPNPESIARGLATLFQASTSDLQPIGARGRMLATSRFTWPKIAADLKAVYDWVLGGGSKPSCLV